MAKRGKSRKRPGKSDDRTEIVLTKGQARKLDALRRSVGQDIADRAFAAWLKAGAGAPAADRNAALIADTLGPLVRDGKLQIPRGGYVLTRGKGRVIVERAVAE